jgi:hypothetical protein
MQRPAIDTHPLPGEVWLSCPPYLLLAQIVAVDDRRHPAVVSYELHDDDGSVLGRVNQARLDPGWWQCFQPLQRRYG